MHPELVRLGGQRLLEQRLALAENNDVFSCAVTCESGWVRREIDVDHVVVAGRVRDRRTCPA